MKEHKCIAQFKGHKVRNAYKVIIRFYDNPLQPWTYLVYDDVYKSVFTLPKEELYDYVFGEIFSKRKLFTSGREMENLFAKMSLEKRHYLVSPEVLDKVCFLKKEIVCQGDIDYKKISTLNPTLSKKVDWLTPHPCLDITDNITGTTKTLIVTIPEYQSIVSANPAYFDIKEKTR